MDQDTITRVRNPQSLEKRTRLDGDVGHVAPADLHVSLAATRHFEERDRTRGRHGRRRTESRSFGDGALDEDEDLLRAGFRRRDILAARLDQVGEDPLGSGDKVGRPVVLFGQREVVSVPGQVDFDRRRRVLGLEVPQDDDRLARRGRCRDRVGVGLRRFGREGDQDIAFDGGRQDAEPAIVDVLACPAADVPSACPRTGFTDG